MANSKADSGADKMTLPSTSAALFKQDDAVKEELIDPQSLEHRSFHESDSQVNFYSKRLSKPN